MRRPSSRRPGFTLIELLVVITIIGILAGITFGLFRAANISRNKSKSVGDIQAIAMACQSYRKTYGDYPCSQSGTDERFRRDLLDQLLGRRVLRFTTPGLPPTLTEIPVGGTMRSFLSLGDVGTNDDTAIGDVTGWRGGATAACREFVDAWGNPYDYRYKVLVSAARYAEWKSPNYLFVSAGANFVEPATEGDILGLTEYWDPTPASILNMTSSGIVPATYFDETGGSGPYRADNLVNWTN